MTNWSNELKQLESVREKLTGRMAILKEEMDSLAIVVEDINTLTRVRRVLEIIVETVSDQLLSIPIKEGTLSLLKQLEPLQKIPRPVLNAMFRLEKTTIYQAEMGYYDNRIEQLREVLTDSALVTEWFLENYKLDSTKLRTPNGKSTQQDEDNSLIAKIKDELEVAISKGPKVAKTVSPPSMPIEPEINEFTAPPPEPVIDNDFETQKNTIRQIPPPIDPSNTTDAAEEENNRNNKITLIPYRQGSFWGFVDPDKNTIIKPQYTDVEPFIVDITAVKLKNKWGFINKEGKTVVPFQYDEAGSFKIGLSRVRKGQQWGFVNKKGEETVPTQYDGVLGGSAGLAIVRQGDKWGFTNKYGKIFIEPKFQYVYPFSDGLAAVMNDTGKCGYINREDALIITFMYDYGGPFRSGLAVVELFGKRGYINKSGRTIIPLDYDKANDFRGGLAAVKKDHKWGFINKSGDEVIDFKYDYAFSFYGTLALVQKHGEWGYIDREGNEVISIMYNNADSFSEDLAAVQVDDKWGVINKEGKMVIPFEYDFVGNFTNGIAFIIKNKGKTKGFIDTDGYEYFSD